MPRVSSCRTGAAIIEVLIAFVVLAMAGMALVTLLGQGHVTVAATHRREREQVGAQMLLDAATAWSRQDLDLHVGSTRTRGWVLTVQPISAALYALAVSDTNGVAMLHTALYRPDSVSP